MALIGRSTRGDTTMDARSGPKLRRAPALVAALLACSALLACASLSLEDYAVIVEDARACNDGDSCVLAGGGQCTCAAPVNASQAQLVDDAAEDVDCNGAQVECVTHDNLRCEAGRCASDVSP